MVPAGALSGQRCFRAAFRALFLCFYSKKQTGFYLNVTKKKMSKWCVSCKRRSSETQHHNPQTRNHLMFKIPAFWFPNMMTGNPARMKDNVFSELQQPQWNTSSVIHFLLCSAVSAEYAELSASVGKRPHCWGLELVAEIKQDVLLLVSLVKLASGANGPISGESACGQNTAENIPSRLFIRLLRSQSAQRQIQLCDFSDRLSFLQHFFGATKSRYF